jgi:hypothetical protein
MVVIGVNVGFENTHALRSICANAPLQLRPTRTAYYLTCPPTFPSRITHEELGELDDNVSFVPCDPSSALNNKVLDARVTVIVIAIGPPVAPETSYSGTAPPTVRVMDPNNPLRAGSNSRRLLESRKYQLYVQST